MEFTIGIEPRTGVSLDPFGPRNEPKLPPYRFEAAVRTRVPEGSPVSPPLAVFSGNLEKDRDNGGRLVARIPLTGIPHQQGQELEFLVGVAPVDNNTQGALLDAEGKPVAAALGKTVTYPWPSADPAAVTLTADLTMGKVRVAGRLKAVPENWFVILSDPNGKEWRVRIRRYEPTDIEARIKSDFGLAEIGFNPAVQDGYSLLVKDTDGVEVLRLPLKTVLAPLPKAGDEEDDLFFDDERDANSFTNGGIDLNTIMKMFQNQGTGVGGNGTGAAGTAPFVAPGTPGGSTSMDADALQRMMEAMLADGANPPAPDAPDTGGGNDGIWFSDGE